MLERTRAFLLRMAMAAVSVFLGVAITSAACALPSSDTVVPGPSDSGPGQGATPPSSLMNEAATTARELPALPTPPSLPSSLGSPTQLTVLPGDQEDEVLLQWVAGNNATTHLIYLSEGSGENGRYWAQTDGTSSQTVVDGLEPGKEYLFIVIAGQEEGDSAQVQWSQWSNWAQVGPKQALVFPDPPMPPARDMSQLVAGLTKSRAAVVGVVLSISDDRGTFTIQVVDSEIQGALLPAKPVTVRYESGSPAEKTLQTGSYVGVEGQYNAASNVLYAHEVEPNIVGREPAEVFARENREPGEPPGDAPSPQESSAIFDGDSDFRVITTYGDGEQVELSDYLETGATGVTFELKSCDQSAGDYYDSVAVENGVLTLEPNTLGHVHGTNTQEETVCTVTATSGGVSEDQEFSVYTVSDRTPAALQPGSLTIEEARPTELDVRLSLPGSSRGYVRLGWRKVGESPTFAVVWGVSDGSVITISGLEPGTDYEVRAYLMTPQAFDLYRFGNSGPAETLIPEGQPDSKWIRNLVNAGLGKSQTATITTAAAPPPPPPPPPVLEATPVPAPRPTPEGDEEDDGVDTPTPTDNDGIDTPTPTVTDNDGIDTPTPTATDNDGIDTPTPTVTDNDGIDTPTPTPTATDNDGIDTPTPTVTDNDGVDTPTPTVTDNDGVDTPTPTATDNDGIDTPTPTATDNDGIDTPTPTVTDNDGIDTPTPTVTDNDGIDTPTPTATDNDGIDTPTPTATDNDGIDTPTPTVTDNDGVDTPTPTDNDGTDSDGIDTPTPVTPDSPTPDTPTPDTPEAQQQVQDTPSPVTPPTPSPVTPPTPSPVTPPTPSPVTPPTPSPATPPTPSPATPPTPSPATPPTPSPATPPTPSPVTPPTPSPVTPPTPSPVTPPTPSPVTPPTPSPVTPPTPSPVTPPTPSPVTPPSPDSGEDDSDESGGS